MKIKDIVVSATVAGILAALFMGFDVSVKPIPDNAVIVTDYAQNTQAG